MESDQSLLFCSFRLPSPHLQKSALQKMCGKLQSNFQVAGSPRKMQNLARIFLMVDAKVHCRHRARDARWPSVQDAITSRLVPRAKTFDHTTSRQICAAILCASQFHVCLGRVVPVFAELVRNQIRTCGVIAQHFRHPPQEHQLTVFEGMGNLGSGSTTSEFLGI